MKSMAKTGNEKAAGCYAAVMLLIYPLFFQNNFINIVQAKKYFFLAAALIYLILCLAAALLCRMFSKTAEKKAGRHRETAVCILLSALVISTLTAKDAADAFLGGKGLYFGAVTLFAGIVSYLLTARYFRMSQAVLWSFLLGSGIVFVLGILNAFQVDILHMKDNLAPSLHYFFVGTMGNMDITAGYGGIMIPFGMTLYLQAGESFSCRVYGGYLLLGFSAMLCFRCDTAVVCIAAAFLILYWFALCGAETLHRANRMAMLWILASVFVGLLRHRFFEQAYEFDGLCLLAVSAGPILAETAAFGALCGYARFMESKDKTAFRRARNHIYTALAAAAMAAVICAAVINLLPAERMEGTVWNSFRITDSFGNYRGYIWKRSLRAFRDAPLWNQLFGYGMNQFPVFIQAFEEEMLTNFKSVFLDAHNECLQILASLGMVGCAGFYGISAAVFRRCVQSLNSGPDGENTSLAGICVILVYLIQGIANSPQVFTLPLYFLFLGIFAAGAS